MVVTCCVYGCYNRGRRDQTDKGISFYRSHREEREKNESVIIEKTPYLDGKGRPKELGAFV
jgi:hypothetical protein